MNVLDLFSGIGGFSLGLERAGMRTVAFCEIEPFPRLVLSKRWPGIPIYDDVRTLTADRLRDDGIRVDAICGGFPCQDVSIAGRQAGIEAARSGLWSEIVRLTRDIRPRVIIVENVTNLISGPSERRGGWFGRVLGDLAEIGYDAEWDCVQASAIGAPHGRDRVWMLAYPHEIGRQCPPFGYSPFRQLVRGVAKDSWASEPAEAVLLGVDDGFSDWVDRRAALGNAVVPQIAEIIGRAIMRVSDSS